jgi:hypothetical protein
LLGLACFLGVTLAVYRPVLLDDRQFAYRDASNFYYPLYLRVQQEWDAGRVPLWDPWESAGIPLLGNPMSAVLYPGKLIYAFMPYPWAARLYVIAHTIIAYLGMLALARSLGVSWIGSNIAGLSYAFGAPILFQYSNVIFLVGAAWVPWGWRAIDRLLRQGRRFGVIELAVVLAMQVLGGDPAAAYLTAVCAVGYAVILAKDRGDTASRTADYAVIAAPNLAEIPGGWHALGGDHSDRGLPAAGGTLFPSHERPGGGGVGSDLSFTHVALAPAEDVRTAAANGRGACHRMRAGGVARGGADLADGGVRRSQPPRGGPGLERNLRFQPGDGPGGAARLSQLFRVGRAGEPVVDRDGLARWLAQDLGPVALHGYVGRGLRALRPPEEASGFVDDLDGGHRGGVPSGVFRQVWRANLVDALGAVRECHRPARSH